MNSKVNIEIEYLRAAAILLVIFNHLSALINWGEPGPPYYGMEEWLFNIYEVFVGWAGVDLFFCISGYVISLSFVQLLDENKATGREWIAAKAFWVRRLFRLIPAAWLWLFVMVVCSVIFNESGIFTTLKDNLNTVPPIVFYYANFVSLDFGMIPNTVYWSLSTEEQFYFLFPVFLIVFAAPLRWKVLIALILIQIIPARKDPSDLLWFLKFDAIMYGVLIYQFSHSEMYRKLEVIIFKRPWIVIASSFVLLALLGIIPAHIKSHGLSLIALTSAGLVFLASYNRGYVLKFNELIGKILLWIGSRSYGLYLIHLPAFKITYELWYRMAGEMDNSFTPVLVLTAIPLLYILAETNYKLVETPLRRKGALISKNMLNKKYGGQNEIYTTLS